MIELLIELGDHNTNIYAEALPRVGEIVHCRFPSVSVRDAFCLEVTAVSYLQVGNQLLPCVILGPNPDPEIERLNQDIFVRAAKANEPA